MDRDNSLQTDADFFVDGQGEIFYRLCYKRFQQNTGLWEDSVDELKNYEGVMTCEEIEIHPDWALHFEELAVRERDCTKDLEEITKSQKYTFLAAKGETISQIEYVTCTCCDQIFCREQWWLKESGEVTLDTGYEPEIHLSRHEVEKYAPLHNGPGRLGRYAIAKIDGKLQ